MRRMAHCVSDIERKWYCRAVFADTVVAESDRTHTQFEAAWQEAYSIAMREADSEVKRVSPRFLRRHGRDVIQWHVPGVKD
jgi:hypothetical protein